MEDLERMNTPSTNEIIQDNSNNESNIIVIDEQKEEGKLDNNVVKKDSFEYLEEFVNKIKNGEKLQIEDFNLYHKIKKCNEISPLMIFILEKSIDKYNGKILDLDIFLVLQEKKLIIMGYILILLIHLYFIQLFLKILFLLFGMIISYYQIF